MRCFKWDRKDRMQDLAAFTWILSPAGSVYDAPEGIRDADHDGVLQAVRIGNIKEITIAEAADRVHHETLKELLQRISES